MNLIFEPGKNYIKLGNLMKSPSSHRNELKYGFKQFKIELHHDLNFLVYEHTVT